MRAVGAERTAGVLILWLTPWRYASLVRSSHWPVRDEPSSWAGCQDGCGAFATHMAAAPRTRGRRFVGHAGGNTARCGAPAPDGSDQGCLCVAARTYRGGEHFLGAANR